MIKLAHKYTNDNNEIYEQDLKQHLEHAAILCQEYMRDFGAPHIGYILGLLHDLGKVQVSFQKYITTGASERKVIHSSAGAILLQQFMTPESPFHEQIAIRMMSEAIFAHHEYLPDNISPKGKAGYQARLCPDNIEEFPEAEAYFWTEIISKTKFEAMLREAFLEMQKLVNRVRERVHDAKEFQYVLGLIQKYLLSCLIDADWMDSMLFEESGGQSYEEKIRKAAAEREGRKELFSELQGRLEEKLQGMVQKEGPLNNWRQKISNQCKAAAARKGGIYTLSCPTGAGKTLASLRFAMEHCLQADKHQIFYIIPFTSIIDQCAESIKQILKNGEKDELVEKSILELHSAKETEREIDVEKSEKADFLAKRMAEPIVFTTMVRFLNTFFAKGNKNLRPMHQYQNAVIIFDEIQSLNIKHIGLFNGVINFLAEVCNCTCVLCTATQPLLGATQKPVYPVRLQPKPQLVDLPKEAYQTFKRTEAIPLLKPGDGYSAEEIARLLVKKAEENGNVLLIMNTKSAALKVFEETENLIGSEYEVLYLSTLLYPKHRKEVILKIRDGLRDKKKLVVVSTQIVEAGVDFDFKCVIRSLARLDSIVQAAGRCNREGRNECGNVYIINPDKQLERLDSLHDLAAGRENSYRVIQELEAAPERLGNDLFSDLSVKQFFTYYFYDRQPEMGYRIPGITEYSLYDLLSDNGSLVQNGVKHFGYQPTVLNQAFKEAAKQFEAIEKIGEPVFVPRGEGHALWEKVQTVQNRKEYKTLLKEAQQYIVNVNEKQLKKIGSEKGVLFWEEKMNMYVVNEMYYHEKKGLIGETGETIPLLEW